MKNTKTLEIIKKYLEKCKLMQVATSKNNKPSIFNCWFSYDKSFNFYYISPQTAQHSKNLIKNVNVGISITSPKMSDKGVGPKIQGLMLEGTVKQVKEKELLIAYLNFFKKYPNIKKYIQLVNKKVQLKNTKIYKFTPTKGIWFDQINFEKGNEKQEIKFN